MFLLVFFCFFLPVSEDVAELVEVFFENESYSLCCQRVTCEISVVGLVVDAEGYVSVWRQEVADVEVADEGRLVFRYVVAVAELPVEEEAVIEYAA